MSSVAQQVRKGAGRRAAFFLAAAALLAAGHLPLWSMRIVAPQYPEGLRVTVSAGGLSGDIPIINTLNHYIGMKPLPLETAEVPEFRWLRPAFVALAALALAAGLAGRRRLGALAAGVTGLALAAGAVDLYRWLYVYGHDLDPQAPLRVKPFTPPLLGSNRLYNFVTTSVLEPGGWLALLALAAMAWVVWRWPRYE